MAPQRADRVVVLKAERRIQLLVGERVLSEYRIALGSEPEGPKERKGDGRTPEGRYVLDWRKEESEFHRAIHISYPDEIDREWSRSRGYSPGGSIMIHGLPNGLGIIGDDHRKQDWTDGCIAVTNQEMDEIWKLVEDGTPIEIRP